MDIPNLSKTPASSPATFPLALILIVVVAALLAGFGLSRAFPQSKNGSSLLTLNNTKTVSTDTITSADQLKIGVLYGDTQSTFKDSATGTVQKGGINGVGTHTLIRNGGPSQSAALTSSTVDLDLFVGKKVEIKGETNASPKVSWLLDVGTIKILE
jgi:hypothetical protein